MSEKFGLVANLREKGGKGENRRLRRLDNRVAAVLYGGGKEPQMLSFEQNKIRRFMEEESFYSSILSLDIAGKKEKAVIKAIHRHPSEPIVLHMDFQRIKADEAISMRVPLHFIGADIAPGVKLGGGSMSHHLTEVEIKCLPEDLPEFIDLDVSQLELDQSLHLSDIKLPKGIEITALAHASEHDLPVVTLHVLKTKAIEEEAPAVEEPTEETAETPESNSESKEK